MTSLLNTLQTQSTLYSATRFMIVGILGTVIDFGLFALLNTRFGLSPLLANSLSYSAGMINNYTLHRKWTFAQQSKKSISKQFSQFAGVSLSALAVNNLIVLLLTPLFSAQLSDISLATVLAKVCAIAVGVGWNFLANYLWTFRAVDSF